MLDVQTIPRVFIHTHNGEKIRLEDPNGDLSPEAVCNHFSHIYEILTTAKVVGPAVNGDVQEFEFVSTIGTKG